MSELPRGWTEATVDVVCEKLRGVSYDKNEASREEKDGLVPILRANNIDSDHLTFVDLVFVPGTRVSGKQKLQLNDVVVAMSSGSKSVVGKTAQVLENWHGSFGAFCGVLRPTPQIDGRYFGYFFRTREYRAKVSELSAGTNINNLKNEHFGQLNFPVPPLNEQRRIVARLENLLSRVDAAQARLTTIPLILRRFRQSVLAAACSGRLTADWRTKSANRSASSLLDKITKRRKELWAKQRKTKGLTAKPTDYPEPARPSDEFEFDVPESWETCSMDALTSVITSGSRDWKQYYKDDGSGTFIMAQNIRPKHFDSSYRLAVAPPENDRDRTRSEVFKEDLLVTIVGANTGDSCRVPRELHEHYVCQSVALMRPVLPSTSPFLEGFLNSTGHGLAQYKKWIYGEGRPHLSFDHLRETLVCLPPLGEQQEIVRRVEALFKTADALEARYLKAKEHVDKLTQSILAKAFRGELVPQDPNDEPASALLQRIRNQRAPESPQPHNRTNRRRTHA